MAKQCQCPSCTAQRAYRDNATVERVRSRVLANAKARGLARPHDSYALRKFEQRMVDMKLD